MSSATDTLALAIRGGDWRSSTTDSIRILAPKWNIPQMNRDGSPAERPSWTNFLHQ